MERKIKLKYTGPEHRILITSTHHKFIVKGGDIVMATEEEAKELIKASDKERIFKRLDTKEVKNNG